jgi:hypothetical protein
MGGAISVGILVFGDGLGRAEVVLFELHTKAERMGGSELYNTTSTLPSSY